MTKGYGCRHEGLATIYELPNDGLTESERTLKYNQGLRKLAGDAAWKVITYHSEAIRA